MRPTHQPSPGRRISIALAAVLSLCPVPTGLEGPESVPVEAGNRRSDRLSAGHRMACTVCHVKSEPDGGAERSMAHWNVSESNTPFRLYGDSSGRASHGVGPSAICLSCHDGVTAPDRHGRLGVGRAERRGPGVLAARVNDHPFGVPYPPRGEYGRLRRGYRQQPRGDLPLALVDGQSRVECISCHDPHGSRYPKMLRESPQGSLLCFGCHDM